MKAVLQRVRRASVEVKSEVVGHIEQGLVILLGLARGDTPLLARALAEKIPFLRIFSDTSGKMNQSLQDVKGSVLVISQFTLLANTNRGRRPSFEAAAAPDEAKVLYDSFIQHLHSFNLHVETGVFGATMVVTLENDGPVTIILDTSEEKGVN